MQATQTAALTAFLIAAVAAIMSVREIIRLHKEPLPDYVKSVVEQSEDQTACRRFLVREYTIAYLFFLFTALCMAGSFLIPFGFMDLLVQIGLIAGVLWLVSVRFRQRRFIKQEESWWKMHQNPWRTVQQSRQESSRN